MKTIRCLLPLLCVFALCGCDAVSEKVNAFIENDANIGKNAPAVMGSIADIEEINKAAEESERAEKTPEELAAEKAAAERKKLEERADELLSEMTTAEKTGQLLLARIPEGAAEKITEYNFGGYTMYAEDFENETPETVAALTAEISEAIKIAPFIAVDEEGGTVVRISKYSQFREEPFSSPQLLYSRGGTELLEIDTTEKAQLLKSLGINLNLAPVADISTNEESYIYPRTMGTGAETAAEGIAAIVRTSGKHNIASCLKHFPGYGENTDTHKNTSVDSRELSEFLNRDFVTFRAGIAADESKPPMVMMGHTVYESIDSGVPASLSEKLHEILRDELEFDGVIITDDMGMDAIKEYESEESVYTAAVLAGNDMLCVTDWETAYNDLTAAYENGTLTDDILDSHVRRILIMKLQYGIIK